MLLVNDRNDGEEDHQQRGEGQCLPSVANSCSSVIPLKAVSSTITNGRLSLRQRGKPSKYQYHAYDGLHQLGARARRCTGLLIFVKAAVPHGRFPASAP